MNVDNLANEILQQSNGSKRFIVAIAGPPGAGKSTLAESLAARLKKLGEHAVVVPMDGFHFDNCILEERDWLTRKGAPYTFDAGGFVQMIDRIRNCEEDVYAPVFDRSLGLARAGAQCVNLLNRIVVVEGNYLLLSEKPWAGLKRMFDLSVFLHVDMNELEARSIARWLHYDYTIEEARKKAWSNDLPNSKYVIDNSFTADIVLNNQESR